LHKNSHTKRVYIHAAAALGPHGDIARADRRTLSADPAPLELNELVKKVVGAPLRQASHLVELAAIGSQLCLKRLPWPAPENTAVYLGTGLADVRKNDAVFRQVMPPASGMASPFDFINAANNMAAFYVAKLGNFIARNLTVTQVEFSFEWALRLAFEDLRAGQARQALVGGVDENSQPRRNHLRWIALRDDEIMGEGAGFLYISTEAAGARGELLGVFGAHNKTPVEALQAALSRWQCAHHEPFTLLPGFRLDANDLDHLTASFPEAQIERYLGHCGVFHTAAAFGVADRCAETGRDSGLSPLTLHINRNAFGQVMLIGLRCGQPKL